MNENLEKKLIEENKEFFSEELETRISCGDGWYKVINEALQKIRNLSKDIIVLRIKEKQGALRIYIKNLDPKNEKYGDILDIIDIAEIKSKTICEYCGSHANFISYHGLLKTICASCLQKMEAA